MKQAIQNGQLAFKKLQDFITIAQSQPVSEMNRAAVIQAFEFNFEVFWKIFQKIAATQGITANSPKSAFAAAFQIGLIDDQSVWLAILNDRNLTTHTYHENLAQDIFERITASYLNAFQKALKEIAKKT